MYEVFKKKKKKVTWPIMWLNKSIAIICVCMIVKY